MLLQCTATTKAAQFDTEGVTFMARVCIPANKQEKPTSSHQASSFVNPANEKQSVSACEIAPANQQTNQLTKSRAIVNREP